jgi:RNA polymerase sigma factor (sigma-70 family)
MREGRALCALGHQTEGKRLIDRGTSLVKARNKLVEDNIRLVYYEVNRLNRWLMASGVLREDAVQAGMVGLIRAAEFYDPNRISPITNDLIKFSTFACRCIFQRIQDQVNNNSVVRVPKRTDKLLPKCRTNSVSHRPFEDSEDYPILVEDAEIPFDEYEAIQRAMNHLYPKYKTILKLRFWQHMTLEEIGQRFNITRERVRQIQNTAIKILRRRITNDRVRIQSKVQVESSSG